MERPVYMPGRGGAGFLTSCPKAPWNKTLVLASDADFCFKPDPHPLLPPKHFKRNHFDQHTAIPPTLTSPAADNLPACRCVRSPFSRPRSELISLSGPHRPRRHDRRNRNTTDNSRTLLIPSPARLLLLCNICLSLGGFAGGEEGEQGMQIVWNTFQNINDERCFSSCSNLFFIKSVWYRCFHPQHVLWFLLCVSWCALSHAEHTRSRYYKCSSMLLFILSVWKCDPEDIDCTH